MTAVTLDEIKARQSEISALIQQYEQAAKGAPRTIEIPADDIELAPGEHYAGAVLDAQGEHQYYLVLMADTPESKLNWEAAMAWAEKIGGALPTRQEAALLFANCKPHLQPYYHWTSEQYENDASYAWSCDFGNGGQFYYDKSDEGRAVAVRRV